MQSLPAIQNQQALSIPDLETMANHMVRSGFFKDATDVSKAVVKITIGQELGLPAGAAMRGIDIAKGQVIFRAHLMAAMIKRSGRYNYRVVEQSSQKCTIAFTENGEALGETSFTMEDAKLAGLSGKETYRQHPGMMLYNRAMSQGARIFCPDLFLGAIYGEGELEEGVEVVNAESQHVEAHSTEVEVIPMATDKQIQLIRQLLAQRGTLKGTTQAFLKYVYPDGLTLNIASDLIEHIQGSVGIPDTFFRRYVKMIADQSGITAQEILAYARTWFDENANGVSGLGSDEQRQLMTWLGEQQKDMSLAERLDEMVIGLSQSIDFEPGEIHEWITNQVAAPYIELDEEETAKAIIGDLSKLDLDDLKAQITAFFIGARDVPASA